MVESGFSANLGGIALDPAGNLWATETVNAQGRVVRQAPDGSKTTFTGFRYPEGSPPIRQGVSMWPIKPTPSL